MRRKLDARSLGNAITAALLLTLTAATRPASPTPPPPVLWAWERWEDLRFADRGVTIAILAGTVRLDATGVQAQPRLQPALVLPGQPITGVVHLEITSHPTWTPQQREKTAAVTLALLKNPRFTAVQIDFEVKASDRPVLLDVLTDVRAGLAPGRQLSMTALASWCDTETWIDAAPVDEVVPMLFRMGPAGDAIRQRLAHGGDFRQKRCHSSIGVATDTPPDAIPPGRKVWIFNPCPWIPTDLTAIREKLHT